MKKYWHVILLAVIAIVVIVLGVRFFSGEDDWICQNGEWVKHGNPSAEKPVGNCGKIIENQQAIPIENQSQVAEKINTEKEINQTENQSKAEEANIIVSSPIENATVSSPFNVEGKARVFENVVSIRLEDKDGKILFQGTTNAQSPDTGQYGLFQKEIKYTTSQTEGILKVFESSAKDGSEINEVIIPVKFGIAEENWTTGGYWLCRNEEWISFGKPSVPEPTKPCEK